MTHRAARQKTVIPRACGGSSNTRRLDLIANAWDYRITRSSRVMTSEFGAGPQRRAHGRLSPPGMLETTFNRPTPGETLMSSITAIANDFFAACETGKGWDGCKIYCAPDATFAAQAEPLAGIKTLAEYADWMKGLMTIMPDGSYEVKSFATDSGRNNVAVYATFSGTHTGPGGPCEPTGKKTSSDYVYVIQFADDKIRHMTKIWHSGMALKELGWA
jgi:predicted ester cyclase